MSGGGERSNEPTESAIATDGECAEGYWLLDLWRAQGFVGTVAARGPFCVFTGGVRNVS